MKKEIGPMNFRVKSGVAIPNPHLSLGKKYDFPFATMKVTECFDFPVENDGVIAMMKARGAVLRYAAPYKLLGKRFTTRVVGPKMLRVWRIT